MRAAIPRPNSVQSVHCDAPEAAVITSAATDQEKAKADLRSLTNDVLAATDQEAVFLSVGGDAEIIE